MSDEEYRQEGINMQLKPIKDKLDSIADKLLALEKRFKEIEETIMLNTCREITKPYCPMRVADLDQIKENKEFLRELSLRTYNLHQAILTNTPLNKLTIGKSLFKLYETLDAKKEYIASLNDPKAFEAINLGALKRERVSDSGNVDISKLKLIRCPHCAEPLTIEKGSRKRNMEFYHKGYEVGREHGKNDSIRKFQKIVKKVVKQIKGKYGQDAKGSEYLENLFKDEIKKLEEMLKK